MKLRAVAKDSQTSYNGLTTSLKSAYCLINGHSFELSYYYDTTRRARVVCTRCRTTHYIGGVESEQAAIDYKSRVVDPVLLVLSWLVVGLVCAFGVAIGVSLV